jgi:hypothetical protein
LDVSEEIVDQLLSNCPETLWKKKSFGGRNALQLSLSSADNLTSMLREKIVHYAREFKTTNSHDNFLNLFRSNCVDQPTLKWYCEEWPDFAHFDLERGARPLHIACAAPLGYSIIVHVIPYLITRAPDVLALQDRSGQTPLHSLLDNESLADLRNDPVDSLISIILEANPKVLTVRDNEGFTPLLVASRSNLSLTSIYSMLRFEPQSNLSSSWFSDSNMGGPIQRKRKR